MKRLGWLSALGGIALAGLSFVSPATAAEAACELLSNQADRSRIGAALERRLMILCGEVTLADLVSRRAEVVDDGAASVIIGTDVPVSNPALDTGGTTQSESSLIVVGDTGALCGAWNDAGEDFGGDGFSGFGFSLDGGATWTDGGPFPDGPTGDTNFGDPSLAYSDRDETVYYAALSTRGLSLWQSRDRCQSFSYVGPIHAGSGDDKELMAVDNTPASPFYGRIYVGWTNFSRPSDLNVVSFSDDGGATWSTPAVLAGSGSNGQGMWPAVAPNGDAYFALVDRSNSIGGLQDQWIYKSTNGGGSWTQMTDIGSNQKRPENVSASQSCFRQALNGDVRNLSSPQIVINEDGAASAGYVIHAIYAYDSDGNGADESNVFYRQSTDGAATWSAETQVNDDGTSTDQWFPAIGVNGDGVLLASWYDRRLDTAANLDFDRYAAVSTDGGATWGANQRVSDVSSPVSQNNPHFDGLATCYHGDYDQVAVDDTTGHILWSDDRRIVGTQPNPDMYYDQIDLAAAPVECTLELQAVRVGETLELTWLLGTTVQPTVWVVTVLASTVAGDPPVEIGRIANPIPILDPPVPLFQTLPYPRAFSPPVIGSAIFDPIAQTSICNVTVPVGGV